MKDGRVSVVVPVYNAASTLEMCALSILGQSYNDVQLVLINDGSKDSSIDICHKLAENYNNVLVIDKPNEGVSATRNKGIEACDGQYVMFVDSDDYIEKDMVEAMVSKLLTDNADLCMCGITIHKEGEESIKPLMNGHVRGKENIAEKVFELYKTNYINSPCNKLYKKELITEGFSKDISLGEDLLFNLNYLENCNSVTFIDKGFYHYQFVNNQSLTSKYREDSFKIALRLYEAVTGYGNKFGVPFDKQVSARDVFMNIVFYSIQDLYYYSKEDKKYKRDNLKVIVDNPRVREVVNALGDINGQQKLVAKFISRNNLFLIRVFFKMKKLIARA